LKAEDVVSSASKNIGDMMNPANIQTPEQMIERWMGVMCSCDPDVGHLCECCHDTQVVREVLKSQAQLQLERDACADAMDQEHIRANAMEAALKIIREYKNTDIAELALCQNMACAKCTAALHCEVAFDRYNLDTEPGIDCLAAK
jgi:hypothetical protein